MGEQADLEIDRMIDEGYWPGSRRRGRGGKRRSRRRKGKNRASVPYWKHSKPVPCLPISDAQVECLRKLVDGCD